MESSVGWDKYGLNTSGRGGWGRWEISWDHDEECTEEAEKAAAADARRGDVLFVRGIEETKADAGMTLA